MANTTSTLALAPLPLPPGITSSYVDCTSSCGLKFHVLTSGQPGNPLVLFTHGFPELAFSWRKILPAIAAAGYYCVAPDQRGFGRTTGLASAIFRPDDDDDLDDYVATNLVRDLVCLVYRLGYTSVHCIVGHDFGALISATAALVRPDFFLSTVQMSHPYRAPSTPSSGHAVVDIQADLARLDPPRKHYKWYNSSPTAAADWESPAHGLESFLRGYFYLKSDAGSCDPRPHPLATWDAASLAEMPAYYIMPANMSMPEVVAHNTRYIFNLPWMTLPDVRVYVNEWTRTGFQGALNWYRAVTSTNTRVKRDLLLFAGRPLSVPCVYIAGESDWGSYQQPGAVQGYQNPKWVAAGMFRGVKMVQGAGHWVQQEQPEAVIQELLGFLDTL